MKKRITSMFLVLLMVLSLMPATVQASPASSVSGTKADPYLIATAQDLVDFRDEVNASTKKSTSMLCAKLTKDIDLSNLEGDWEPIGKATNIRTMWHLAVLLMVTVIRSPVFLSMPLLLIRDCLAM